MQLSFVGMLFIAFGLIVAICSQKWSRTLFALVILALFAWIFQRCIHNSTGVKK